MTLNTLYRMYIETLNYIFNLLMMAVEYVENDEFKYHILAAQNVQTFSMNLVKCHFLE